MQHWLNVGTWFYVYSLENKINKMSNCDTYCEVNSLNWRRSQEEESLRAAIALSKQDTVQGDEGETSEEPPTTNGEPDLLLDFSNTGELARALLTCTLSLLCSKEGVCTYYRLLDYISHLICLVLAYKAEIVCVHICTWFHLSIPLLSLMFKELPKCIH